MPITEAIKIGFLPTRSHNEINNTAKMEIGMVSVDSKENDAAPCSEVCPIP